MYFLTEEEKKHLLRGLLPRARETGVAEELRGWNWPQPPLARPGDGSNPRIPGQPGLPGLRRI
ncbi:MAG: CRISPR-associated protein Cas4 [Bacillota bacterium]